MYIFHSYLLIHINLIILIIYFIYVLLSIYVIYLMNILLYIHLFYIYNIPSYEKNASLIGLEQFLL